MQVSHRNKYVLETHLQKRQAYIHNRKRGGHCDYRS